MDITKCPYCAEDVKPDALICKHCGKPLKSLSSSRRFWLFVNCIIGSALSFGLVFGLVAVVLGEFTGLPGGVTAFTEAGSTARNDAAFRYALIAVPIGFVIGAFFGRFRMKSKTTQLQLKGG